jgi:uncharacterized cysteine cluster protein YcgN (CxxCxxCC family)
MFPITADDMIKGVLFTDVGAVEWTAMLDVDNIDTFFWLPETCAYRLLAEGLPLPEWHPLVSGDAASVHRAGMSVAGKVVSESSVAEEDYEDHIIRWV